MSMEGAGGVIGGAVGGLPGAILGSGGTEGGGPFDLSGDPTYDHSYYSGGVLDSADMGIGGTNLHFQNPGRVDPMSANPFAGKYLQNTDDLYGMAQNSALGGAFNPDFYNGLIQNSQNNLQSSMGNLYASRGLAGSSAELGGLQNATIANQMNWLNRQQSDQARALQGLSGLNQMGYNQTMGIQGQYDSFQDAMNQNRLGLLGLQQAQKQGNQEFAGGLIGGLIGAGGRVAAG